MIKSRVGIYINTKTVTDTLTINRRRETHFTKGGNMNNMNIYVGNLPLEVTEEELRQEFMSFGEVTSAIIINDRYGIGQSSGNGFVEMTSRSEGEAAIIALNGKSLKHRTIDVIQALPLSDKKDKGFLHTGSISHFSGRGRKRRY